MDARLSLVRHIGSAMYLDQVLQCIECGSRDVTVSPDARRCE